MAAGVDRLWRAKAVAVGDDLMMMMKEGGEVEGAPRKRAPAEEVAEVVGRWKMVRLGPAFDSLAEEVVAEQLSGFVDLGEEVAEQHLEKVELARSVSLGGAAAELRKQEVLNGHGKCRVAAAVGKTADDYGLGGVVGGRQKAFALLEKGVERQISASIPVRRPPVS